VKDKVENIVVAGLENVADEIGVVKEVVDFSKGKLAFIIGAIIIILMIFGYIGRD